MWTSTVFSGGFGNDSKSADGFMNEISSPASQEKKKADRLNNFVPCTVAHIMQNAVGGEELMKVGSMPASMVTIVGIVRSVDEQSMKVSCYVDDMTSAPVEVQMWLVDQDSGNEKKLSIKTDTYIRVMGVIRSIKGKRLVNAFKIVPITDMNELTMHFLEVIHTSMAVAVMDKQSCNDTSAMNATSVKVEADNHVGVNSSYNFGGANQIIGSFGLNKTQEIVLRAISSSSSEEGVNYDYLYSTIKSINRLTIRETVEFLSNEGHIYSTIDDEHFKSADGG